MSGLRKLIVLAVVLLAIAGLGWLALRSGDPTAFAKGARVELADYKGPNPTGASPSLAGRAEVASEIRGRPDPGLEGVQHPARAEMGHRRLV